MQRNGKLPRVTTTVLEMPASAVLVPADPAPMSASSTPVSASSAPVPASSTPVSADPAQLSTRSRRPHRNAYRTDGSIDQRLLISKVAIETVLNDPKLQDLLTSCGYAQSAMLQGQTLHAQALALVQQQRARIGKQFAATDTRAKTQVQARSIYGRHVGLARVAFRDDRDTVQTLDLSARKHTLAGWVRQAQQFYTNALADQMIIAGLARYGVTVDQLLAAQALIEAVADGIVSQQSRKNLAQETKQARDTALQALDRWMLDFVAVARIALADQPQQLAQLGLGGA